MFTYLYDKIFCIFKYGHTKANQEPSCDCIENMWKMHGQEIDNDHIMLSEVKQELFWLTN